jgi:hypothetical protein
MHNIHLPQSCGVGEIGYFRYEGDIEAYHAAPDIQNIKPEGGCGWIIVSFTAGKKVYKDAFEQLKERFGEPIFQSEKRINKRTKRKFFFVIFDTTKA